MPREDAQTAMEPRRFPFIVLIIYLLFSSLPLVAQPRFGTSFRYCAIDDAPDAAKLRVLVRGNGRPSEPRLGSPAPARGEREVS